MKAKSNKSTTSLFLHNDDVALLEEKSNDYVMSQSNVLRIALKKLYEELIDESKQQG